MPSLSSKARYLKEVRTRQTAHDKERHDQPVALPQWPTAVLSFSSVSRIATGRRSGDQFCVYVDRLVLPALTPDDIEAIGLGRHQIDAFVRRYIHENLRNGSIHFLNSLRHMVEHDCLTDAQVPCPPSREGSKFAVSIRQPRSVPAERAPTLAGSPVPTSQFGAPSRPLVPMPRQNPQKAAQAERSPTR